MKKVLGTIILPTILLLSLLAAGQAGAHSLDEQLITAASNGDTAAVQQLLQMGANIETRSEGRSSSYQDGTLAEHNLRHSTFKGYFRPTVRSSSARTVLRSISA